MPDYLITTRKLPRGDFTAEPGPTRFLKTPTDELPVPGHAIARRKWVDEVLTLAGVLDRHVIGTRRSDPPGILQLV